MAELYEISFYLDSDYRLVKINWKNDILESRLKPFWNEYIGRPMEELSDFRWDKEEGILAWHNEIFRCQEEKLERDNSLILLKKGISREQIYEKVLDTLDESIQIYDEHGNIIYFNSVCNEIVGSDEPVVGKHLLDVFDVEADDSTTLEALRMEAPVRYRFRHYYSRKGKELFTVNSAFPVKMNGRTVAVLALEENISVIYRKAEQLEKLQSAIKEKVSVSSDYRRNTGYTLDDMIGHHPGIKKLRELARKVAFQNNNVLIVGETGTGKEIVAQSIHRMSARKNAPFVALNCAAIPEGLIESILFGTAKGSFTGSSDKTGLLEEADKGTLFLDELNSMSLSMQAKVLRALQEGTFRRVGGSKEYRTDVRVISTCNENPFQLMEQQKLRSDLFYRLATIILDIPPLRERPEDIEELIRHHITQIRGDYAFPFDEIEPSVLWQLQQYSWPGNVRELFHAVDYAMNVAADRVFRLEYLPAYCFRGRERNVEAGKASAAGFISAAKSAGEPDRKIGREKDLERTLQEQMEDIESEIIRETLRRCCGNVTQAAKKLGLQRQSLQYRIRKYGIYI